MSNKGTAAKQTFSQKVKVLSKLYEGGFKTEKEIQSLALEEMLKIPGITIQELTVIMEVQKSVKAHTLYSYLGGGEDEQTEQQSE